MAESKKHHFVPRSVLRNFTTDSGQLYVFDKFTGKSYPSWVENAAHENHFNTVDLGHEKINFESIYQEFDDLTAAIIRKVLSFKSYFHLTGQDLYDLATAVCIQEMRTKLPRTSIVGFAEDMKAWLTELHSKVGGAPSLHIPSAEESKILALRKFEYLEEMIVALLLKGLMIVRVPEGSTLWTSDNPVLMDNHLPYGTPGFNARGSDIFMPVSKTTGIKFICRASCEKLYETYWKSVLLEKRIPTDVEELFNGIYRDRIITLKKEHVDYYNSCQVQISSRFLYGAVPDFSMAGEMIKEAPALKEITKTTKLGEPRKYSGMPKGEHLVLYIGTDDFMIPVILQEPGKDGSIVFVTPDLRKLFPLYHKKQKIDRIICYKDQEMLFIKGQVIISSIDNGKVTIRHSDEGLNTLIQTLKKKPYAKT